VRIASQMWVMAYLRRCAGAGAAAVLERRGDAERGAIFIRLSRLDGTAALLAPAVAVGKGADAERRWQMSHAFVPEAEVDAILARQVGFDPDLWVVVVEDREGRHFLAEALIEAPA
jgi:hypothetical protein